ncbi:MAG TPA: hypothetical protein VKR58_02760 [Aquella sp.]|nr:hypothetical protein [Aquella sp.]
MSRQTIRLTEQLIDKLTPGDILLHMDEYPWIVKSINPVTICMENTGTLTIDPNAITDEILNSINFSDGGEIDLFIEKVRTGDYLLILQSEKIIIAPTTSIQKSFNRIKYLG